MRRTCRWGWVARPTIPGTYGRSHESTANGWNADVNDEFAAQDMNALLAAVRDWPPTVVEAGWNVEQKDFKRSLQVGSQHLVLEVVVRQHQALTPVLPNEHPYLGLGTAEEGSHGHL